MAVLQVVDRHDSDDRGGNLQFRRVSPGNDDEWGAGADLASLVLDMRSRQVSAPSVVVCCWLTLGLCIRKLSWYAYSVSKLWCSPV